MIESLQRFGKYNGFALCAPQILVGLKPATTHSDSGGIPCERFKRQDPDNKRDVKMKRKIIITNTILGARGRSTSSSFTSPKESTSFSAQKLGS